MASSMSKLLSKVVDSLTSIDLQADAVREHFKAQVIDAQDGSKKADDTRTREEVIKAAFKSMLTRELAWLRGLSKKEQARLDQRATGPKFPAHHLIMVGEYGMVLLGLKPCVVIDHGNWDEAHYGNQCFARKHYEHVLKPWFDEFGLSRLGFRLVERVEHAAAPPEIPDHPGFRGGSLFYNAQGPDASLVEEVFLSGKDQVPNASLGKAFGYPGTQVGAAAGMVQYCPVSDRPFRRPDAPNDKLCCICLLEYCATPADARKIGRHYRAVADGFTSEFGIKVTLDMGGCQEWTSPQVAEVLVEAFGSMEAVAKAGESKEWLWWEGFFERRYQIYELVARMAAARR